MLFNSYIFVLLFLPITWCVYFGLNHFGLFKVAHVALVVASFIFYGYQDWKLCLLLLGTIVVNYLFHQALTRVENNVLKKVLLALGIVANLSLLFYFKYFNFFTKTFYYLLQRDYVLKNIILPLGISFFTFQQISMLVDSSKEAAVRYGFWDYALFVSFFPQLIAGPIVLHQELIPQFHDREKKKVHYGNMISGLEYFILGFAKKILVADSFARICDAGYDSIGTLNTYSTILTILAFTLQIYFDFSGYCDMAIGIGKAFNFTLPVNFDSPYKAISIVDFWKRWHMTLTRFLTQYLYIPLGGNRKGKVRTYINIMIVYVLSGLWHGADWAFVLWGTLHGIMQVVYRLGRKVFDRLPKVILWLGTFIFVNLAWVFFRAESLNLSASLFTELIVGGGGFCQGEILAAAGSEMILVSILERVLNPGLFAVIQQIVIACYFLFWIIVCVKAPSSHEIVERKQYTIKYFVFLGIIFMWAFVGLSQVSKFIYFNF